ncbi:MAG TPA: HAD family hydrolase [Candidatus Paceibacterota bacterium]|nr:HAD family hydrolase [Verrucomicrobiota bacterium]HSA09504.1 HAD family hydrolase [Candidatus Paceibacterota bacterium]
MLPVPSFEGLVEFGPGFSPRSQISHVVFDFDGTLSWLRHGWPELMFEVFREYLPDTKDHAGAAVHELLMEDILALNGKSSIHQMIRGVERLRERGGRPPSPEALLREYQKRLDTVIRERTEAILTGKARREDFVVHGARGLLEALRGRGLTLIILSGTIEHRIKEEADLLDLARYFGRHIYGGTADVAQSSKRAVIERLLREEGISGEHLLSLGDGPVEIEVTKAAGGLAVGVASDEERNGSGAMQPQKHKVLAAAGADMLIPDYRDAAALMECILGP